MRIGLHPVRENPMRPTDVTAGLAAPSLRLFVANVTITILKINAL